MCVCVCVCAAGARACVHACECKCRNRIVDCLRACGVSVDAVCPWARACVAISLLTDASGAKWAQRLACAGELGAAREEQPGWKTWGWPITHSHVHLFAD